MKLLEFFTKCCEKRKQINILTDYIDEKALLQIKDVESKSFESLNSNDCNYCMKENCIYENFKFNNKPYINGLNSDLITSSIIISQRPSTFAIKNYNIIQSIKIKNIKVIFNLMNEGEHPNCGPNKKIEQSGFSYIQEAFISEGIKVVNVGWRDPKLSSNFYWVINLIQEIKSYIDLGNKILIHCHCGFERSPLIVAYYLISTTNLNNENIVDILKKKRGENNEFNIKKFKCLTDEDINSFTLFRQSKYLLIDFHQLYVVYPNIKKEVSLYLKNQKIQLNLFINIPDAFFKNTENDSTLIDVILKNNDLMNSKVSLSYYSLLNKEINEQIEFISVPKLIFTCLLKIISLIKNNDYVRENINLSLFMSINSHIPLSKRFETKDESFEKS